MHSEPLLSLIQKNPIIHPSTIQQITVKGDTVVMNLRGFPWWLPTEEVKLTGISSALVEFTSVTRANLTENCFGNDDGQEDLDAFKIVKLDQVSWNRGGSSRVFCSEPVNDPAAVLAALEDFLYESECPFVRSEFLNYGETFNNFVGLVKSGNFEIVSGPGAMCQVVSEELKRQGVKHTTTKTEHEFAVGYLVQWWDGYLICGDAKLSYHCHSY